MYLLDTCTFLWYIETSERLPYALRELINHVLPMQVNLSQATLWEIAIKQSIGKLDLPLTSFELEKKCGESQISILSLQSSYFERIKKLPLIHRDPFDRIIIATAIEENLTLLTSDKNILKYPEVKTLW